MKVFTILLCAVVGFITQFATGEKIGASGKDVNKKSLRHGSEQLERQLSGIFTKTFGTSDSTDSLIRFEKFAITSDGDDTSSVDFPLDRAEIDFLHENSHSVSVMLPEDECTSSQGVDFQKIKDKLTEKGLYPPSQPEDAGFWTQFEEVVKVQVLRQESKHDSNIPDPLPEIMPFVLPNVWEGYDVHQAAEAVHDEFPGIYHINMITQWLAAKSLKPSSVIPKRGRVDFLRGPVLLSKMVGLAIDLVGACNFSLKWEQGRSRPEEIAWKIKEGTLTIPKFVDEDMATKIKEDIDGKIRFNITGEHYQVTTDTCDSLGEGWRALTSLSECETAYKLVVGDNLKKSYYNGNGRHGKFIAPCGCTYHTHSTVDFWGLEGNGECDPDIACTGWRGDSDLGCLCHNPNSEYEVKPDSATGFTAYPEGSPTHPSWPAMHSAASAASFWLDIVMDLTDEQRCEARKLDYSIAYARTVAGVHYPDDNIAGLIIGQEIIAQRLPQIFMDVYGANEDDVMNAVDRARYDWTTFKSSDCYGAYEHTVKACVKRSNIKLYREKTVDECATLCDARDDCRGFEYGVDYGGTGIMQAGHCRLNSSSDTSRCNGEKNNQDFYAKKEESRPVLEFERIVKTCVKDHNLILHPDRTVDECATLCNNKNGCEGFEYGVAHDGCGGKYKSRDCQLKSSSNTTDCNGEYYNLDFYRSATS